MTTSEWKSDGWAQNTLIELLLLEKEAYADPNLSETGKSIASKLVGSHVGLVFRNRERQYDEWHRLNPRNIP